MSSGSDAARIGIFFLSQSSSFVADPPSSPRVDPRHERRKQLAQEIEQRRHASQGPADEIAKLKQAFNALAPVNALPAELLGTIFANLVSHGDLQPKVSWSEEVGFDLQSNLLVEPPGRIADIVRVTHVCKHWRALAVGNPSLWTSFPILHSECVQECLARSSKTFPISISLPDRRSISPWLSDRIAPGVIPLLTDSIHLIRSLHISTKSSEDIALVWRGPLSHPAHRLEELFIQDSRWPLLAYAPGLTDSEQLPLMFNGQVPPRLRVLTLRGVPMPFNIFPRTLVHLDVGNPGSPLPTVHQLRTMLANCPLLATLRLRGYPHLFHPDSDGTVSLPSLAKLYLELQPAEAPGVFLSSIAIPAHADVAIVCEAEEGVDTDFIDLWWTIGMPTIPPCFNGFRRLHLSWEGRNRRLRAYRAGGSDACLGPPALDVDYRDSFGELEPEWVGFLSDWPFDVSEIETVVLAHTPGVEPLEFEQWDYMFDGLPALKTLRVKGLPTPEMELLLDSLRAVTPGGDLFCKDLSTVEIRDVEMSHRALIGLVKVAVVRVPNDESGRVFKRVDLVDCKADGAQLEGLVRRLEKLDVEVAVVDSVSGLAS